jgi:hypothetical protein
VPDLPAEGIGGYAQASTYEPLCEPAGALNGLSAEGVRDHGVGAIWQGNPGLEHADTVKRPIALLQIACFCCAATLLVACASTSKPVRNVQNRTEAEVRAFLKVQYPGEADRMTIRYNRDADAWEFHYANSDNCIDCDFSGSITDDKRAPRIIAIVGDG